MVIGATFMWCSWGWVLGGARCWPTRRNVAESALRVVRVPHLLTHALARLLPPKCADYSLHGRTEVVHALHDINLTAQSEFYPVRRGEFVMLRGPSGGGEQDRG